MLASNRQVATVVENKAAPYTSLYTVLTSTAVRRPVPHCPPPSAAYAPPPLTLRYQVPSKFRVRCRVTEVWPAAVEALTYVADRAGAAAGSGSTGGSADTDKPSHKYFFTLCLDDGTGSVVAIVEGREAVRCTPYTSDDSVSTRARACVCLCVCACQELFLPGSPPMDFRANNLSAQLLAAKLGALTTPGVVFECCLFSYFVPNGVPPYPIQYKLFDTVLSL